MTISIQIGEAPMQGIWNIETEQWDEGADGPVSDKIWGKLLRQHRDALLSTSDWTQTNDSPLSDPKKNEWRIYRQALRDLPETTTTLGMVIEFPEEPS